MKKDSDILIFSVFYIIIFTLIYVLKYYNINSFIFLLLIITVYSFPSLITVLLMLLIERQFKLKIPLVFYLLLSIFSFYISFSLWNNQEYDDKNLYPSLSNEIHIIIFHSMLCHILAYVLLVISKYLINNKNAT